MKGTELFQSGNSVAEQEQLLRFLAREGRTRRRMLSRGFLEKVERTSAGRRGARVIGPSFPDDPYYVLVVYPVAGMSEVEYRTSRRKLLSLYCHAVKANYPQAKDIIGIATESKEARVRSEDALYLNASNWSEENQRNAEKIRDEIGLLKEIRTSGGAEQEYPFTPIAPRLSRNSRCPCGSGKRYKRCCGRDRLRSR